MQLIQMPRQYGKSTIIARLMAADDDSVCICVNQQMVEHMAGMLYGILHDARPAMVVGKTPRDFRDRFFTADTFREKGNRRLNRKVYVDDIDMVLNQLLGVGVDVATYSPPQKWERP